MLDVVTAVAETVGAIGVIVSLVYVAGQIRRNTRASLMSNAQRLNQAARGWWAQLSRDDGTADVWLRGLADYSALKPEESVRFSSLLLEFMTIAEELHYSRGGGDVPSWVGMPLLGRREIMSLPGFKGWYEDRGHWLSPEFRKVLEAEMEQGPGKLAAHYAPAAEDRD